MNCKRLILFLFITLSLLFAWRLKSQSTITGSVKDDKGIALTPVNVVLLTARDSNFVVGATTNDKGIFTLLISHKGNTF